MANPLETSTVQNIINANETGETSFPSSSINIKRKLKGDASEAVTLVDHPIEDNSPANVYGKDGNKHNSSEMQWADESNTLILEMKPMKIHIVDN